MKFLFLKQVHLQYLTELIMDCKCLLRLLTCLSLLFLFYFPSTRRHTRLTCDWSSDVCSSDLITDPAAQPAHVGVGFLVEAQAHEGVDGERGVADPGVAVVPVACAARCFRQAEGGGGEDRSEERRVGKGCGWRWAWCG